MQESPFARKRQRMTELHLASRGIIRPEVLEAFASVPREAFVPEELAELAYEDRPLPIGGDQTISQPYIVARTVEALELEAGERVLEIGTGSGYAAAILGRIAREIYSVERIDWLAKEASERLSRLGFRNVHVHHGDGTLGWSEHAPYDATAVAAGGPVVPQALLDQLAIGGRLVMPVTAADGSWPDARPRAARERQRVRQGGPRAGALRPADRRPGACCGEGRARRPYGASSREAWERALRGTPRTRGGRAARGRRGFAHRHSRRAPLLRSDRAARRIDPRKLGVLPDARAHHTRADLEARLRLRRRRGRLAGRGACRC